jgi:regulator of replication initiation timing
VRQSELEQRILQEEKAIEQIKSETEQLKKENARLAASNARLERFEREHWSGLTPHPSTGDSWSS